LNFEYLFLVENVVAVLGDWPCALEFYHVNCCTSCSLLNVEIKASFLENFCNYRNKV
jgi:hypothetical protein